MLTFLLGSGEQLVNILGITGQKSYGFDFSLDLWKARGLISLKAPEISELIIWKQSMNTCVCVCVRACMCEICQLATAKRGNQELNMEYRWCEQMHRVHQPAWFSCVILDTYLNKENAGCWRWMVIHVDCHKNGGYYNEDQDENSNNEASVKGSPFLLGCTVICRSWKSSTAVRTFMCSHRFAFPLGGMFVFLIKYH